MRARQVVGGRGEFKCWDTGVMIAWRRLFSHIPGFTMDLGEIGPLAKPATYPWKSELREDGEKLNALRQIIH